MPESYYVSRNSVDIMSYHCINPDKRAHKRRHEPGHFKIGGTHYYKSAVALSSVRHYRNESILNDTAINKPAVLKPINEGNGSGRKARYLQELGRSMAAAGNGSGTTNNGPNEILPYRLLSRKTGGGRLKSEEMGVNYFWPRIENKSKEYAGGFGNSPIRVQSSKLPLLTRTSSAHIISKKLNSIAKVDDAKKTKKIVRKEKNVKRNSNNQMSVDTSKTSNEVKTSEMLAYAASPGNNGQVDCEASYNYGKKKVEFSNAEPVILGTEYQTKYGKYDGNKLQPKKSILKKLSWTEVKNGTNTSDACDKFKLPQIGILNKTPNLTDMIKPKKYVAGTVASLTFNCSNEFAAAYLKSDDDNDIDGT